MKASKENYRIYHTHLNPNQKLSIPALAGFLQEAAWLNVKEIGVPTSMLLKQNIAWVLTRMNILINDEADHRDDITVETWPSGSDKYYFYRDFQIYNKKKQIARVTNNWILINLKTRQLTPVPEFLSKLAFDHSKTPLERAKSKIQAPKNSEFQLDIKVNWHQLDINQHTNNTFYLQWILDTIPIEIHQSYSLKEVDIIFKAESLLNESLKAIAEKQEDETYFHQIKNEEGKELVRAKTVWTKKKSNS
ncbi:acyl-[acyl-carrier-protein] thioesterase [Chondrinema litorale]|uniref:acyl-[acyl-carrier-protein] thioesterase n=1 Tax=Chondrinema litorale TaxID=2994555 RepID=UPI002543EAB7|nr:acyl-ACP thioesterase domain-containing protein [Chondrinema litorale]UZR93539.1 thioesterase [Chondrinema litorale]